MDIPIATGAGLKTELNRRRVARQCMMTDDGDREAYKEVPLLFHGNANIRDYKLQYGITQIRSSKKKRKPLMRQLLHNLYQLWLT
jgi:hypothetical protein